jgi:hypothetical protein
MDSWNNDINNINLSFIHTSLRFFWCPRQKQERMVSTIFQEEQFYIKNFILGIGGNT